jgi:hypothetical protein
MPTFVHITSEAVARKTKPGGIRPAKPNGRKLRGVFAMPVTPNFQVSHQWVREIDTMMLGFPSCWRLYVTYDKSGKVLSAEAGFTCLRYGILSRGPKSLF